ncbi:hypothetical protein JZO70_07220 [Enterococcus sp. 669A]|uniref:MapZ extracellular domain-containing protein n=1 Tax=Candidatus Enterococcus moelleringii TaxID=2815325 RepID=A0ABS3LC09_9ENTE|nr:hypothetical protein [Enterococcus sp. 669A]MBO1305944.1 hypothetical protein [Enterococcus sp. 669A]
MTKKMIGWLFLGILVVGTVSFAGYRIYQDRVVETKNERKEAFNQKLKNLYSNQEAGYFAKELDEEQFDQLANEVSGAGESQTAEAIKQAKENFLLQQQMNTLFESDVLNGMELSAHPVLTSPDSETTIPELEEQLQGSDAKDISWGQDIQMILNIAKEQAEKYKAADDSVNTLTDSKAISLSDYLGTVQAVALLPEGEYKKNLLDKLEPIRTKLSDSNEQFAARMQQDESAIASAAASFRQRQAKVLEEKNKDLEELQKEVSEKQETYDSYARISQSRADSVSRSKAAEESRNSSSSSSGSSSSSSTQPSASAED